MPRGPLFQPPGLTNKEGVCREGGHPLSWGRSCTKGHFALLCSRGEALQLKKHFYHFCVTAEETAPGGGQQALGGARCISGEPGRHSKGRPLRTVGVSGQATVQVEGGWRPMNGVFLLTSYLMSLMSGHLWGTSGVRHHLGGRRRAREFPGSCHTLKPHCPGLLFPNSLQVLRGISKLLGGRLPDHRAGP